MLEAHVAAHEAVAAARWHLCVARFELALAGLTADPRVLAAAPFEALEADADFILRHGYTYSGHPAACTGALANLDIIEREGLLVEVTRLGARS